MSFVTVEPEFVSAAAANLRGVGNTVDDGIAFAAPPTTGVLPPAADPVSYLTTAQFAAYANEFQAMAAAAATVHQRFVTTMDTSARSYAATEAVNAASTSPTTEIESVLETYINGAINSPVEAYLSPLVLYLFGLATASTGIAFSPATSAAPAGALIGDDAFEPGSPQSVGTTGGNGILVSQHPADSDVGVGQETDARYTVRTASSSVSPGAAAQAANSPQAVSPTTDPTAAETVSAQSPVGPYRVPSSTTAGGPTADRAGHPAANRAWIPRSPAGG